MFWGVGCVWGCLGARLDACVFFLCLGVLCSGRVLGSGVCVCVGGCQCSGVDTVWCYNSVAIVFAPMCLEVWVYSGVCARVSGCLGVCVWVCWRDFFNPAVHRATNSSFVERKTQGSCQPG